jgi:hypothetical protein
MIWGIGIAACVFVLLLILSTEGLLRLAFELLPSNGLYRWLLLAAAVGVVVWWGWRRTGRRGASLSPARSARTTRRPAGKRKPASGGRTRPAAARSRR